MGDSLKSMPTLTNRPKHGIRVPSVSLRVSIFRHSDMELAS
jgi:hypothetical protein